MKDSEWPKELGDAGFGPEGGRLAHESVLGHDSPNAGATAGSDRVSCAGIAEAIVSGVESVPGLSVADAAEAALMAAGEPLPMPDDAQAEIVKDRAAINASLDVPAAASGKPAGPVNAEDFGELALGAAHAAPEPVAGLPADSLGQGLVGISDGSNSAPVEDAARMAFFVHSSSAKEGCRVVTDARVVADAKAIAVAKGVMERATQRIGELIAEIVEDLERENAALRDTVKEQMEELICLRECLAKRDGDVVRLEDENRAFKTEAQWARQYIGKLETRIADLEKALKVIEKEAAEDRRRFESSNRKLGVDLENLDRRNRELEAENRELKSHPSGPT